MKPIRAENVPKKQTAPNQAAAFSVSRFHPQSRALFIIKVFEDEFSHAQTEDLIHKVTEAVIPFAGEKLRDNTGSRLRKFLADPGELAGRRLVLKMFAQFSQAVRSQYSFAVSPPCPAIV
jgi:hypothetical protein